MVPLAVISVAWSAVGYWALPLIGTPAAWDSAATTGQRALAAARAAPLSRDQRRDVDAHAQTLQNSLMMSRRAAFLYRKLAPSFLVGAVIVTSAFLIFL